MELNCALPDRARLLMRDRAGMIGEPEYAVESDLTLKQRYGASWLVVADGKVAVCDEDSDGDFAAIALQEIKEVRNDELFGGGRLVAETKDGERALIYYTKACVPEFAAMTVVGPDANLWSIGDPRVQGAVISIGVRPLGPAGTYTVNYRVTSADGHPVSGSWSFQLTTAGRGTPQRSYR